MTRSEVLLAILAASDGRPYTPVQIQKAAFLVTKNLPSLIDVGPSYIFSAYDYGPFDSNVYNDAQTMQLDGCVEITQPQGARWNQYAASDKGVERGQCILSRLDERQRDYIVSVSQWVRSLTFEQLVRAIYAHRLGVYWALNHTITPSGLRSTWRSAAGAAIRLSDFPQSAIANRPGLPDLSDAATGDLGDRHPSPLPAVD
jgi:hypothetical protein